MHSLTIRSKQAANVVQQRQPRRWRGRVMGCRRRRWWSCSAGVGNRKSVYQSRRIWNRREKCIVNKYTPRLARATTVTAWWRAGLLHYVYLSCELDIDNCKRNLSILYYLPIWIMFASPPPWFLSLALRRIRFQMGFLRSWFPRDQSSHTHNLWAPHHPFTGSGGTSTSTAAQLTNEPVQLEKCLH